MAMVVPGLIPSFWTSGFPEYPAIFAALAACRLLPPVAALVHHPPDPAGRVVGDVQGAVGAHGHTHRPVLRTGAVLVPEAVRERLVRPDGLPHIERHTHDTIAGGRQGRAVPRAETRHEAPAAKPRGELGAPRDRQPARRPLPQKRDQRPLLGRAHVSTPVTR